MFKKLLGALNLWFEVRNVRRAFKGRAKVTAYHGSILIDVTSNF